MSKNECWTVNELTRETGAAIATGFVLGVIGDGIGAIPGAGVGAAYGVTTWIVNNTFDELRNNCAAKYLPPLRIDVSHAEPLPGSRQKTKE